MVDKTLTQAQQIIKLKQENKALKQQVNYAFDELERQLNFRKQDDFVINELKSQFDFKSIQLNKLEEHTKKLLDYLNAKDMVIDTTIRACNLDLELVRKALTSNVNIFNRKKRIKDAINFLDKTIQDNNELIKSKSDESKNNNIS